MAIQKPFTVIETLNLISKYLSDKEIGILIGVKPSTIYRWKNGERKPTGEFAEKIFLIGEIISKILDAGGLVTLGEMLNEMKKGKNNDNKS